jgi:hypothetical protein
MASMSNFIQIDLGCSPIMCDPDFRTVGLPDSVSANRVTQSAPPKELHATTYLAQTTIYLAPARIKKESSGFGLPPGCYARRSRECERLFRPP